MDEALERKDKTICNMQVGWPVGGAIAPLMDCLTETKSLRVCGLASRVRSENPLKAVTLL